MTITGEEVKDWTDKETSHKQQPVETASGEQKNMTAKVQCTVIYIILMTITMEL